MNRLLRNHSCQIPKLTSPIHHPLCPERERAIEAAKKRFARSKAFVKQWFPFRDGA